jgi:uncharacterized protein with GYD domain
MKFSSEKLRPKINNETNVLTSQCNEVIIVLKKNVTEMPPKLYNDNKERQKAYRERQKKKGFKAVNIYINDLVSMFLKDNPQQLIDAFVELNRDNFIEFHIAVKAGSGEKWYLSNGIEKITISDPAQIETLQQLSRYPSWHGVVRVHPDGRVSSPEA